MARQAGSHELGHLLSTLDFERQRLEQELHDSTGQLFASLQLSLGRLEIENPQHGSLIREIQDIASEIDREMRSLVPPSA